MIDSIDFIHSKRLEKFGIKEFFEKTFVHFKAELNRLRETIYNYNEHQFVFALNERAWLGVFNNAIVKAFPTTSVTLQEYGVYSPINFVGKADFLVHWTDNNGKVFYFLFEAKQYEEMNSKTLPNFAKMCRKWLANIGLAGSTTGANRITRLTQNKPQLDWIGCSKTEFLSTFICFTAARPLVL